MRALISPLLLLLFLSACTEKVYHLDLSDPDNWENIFGYNNYEMLGKDSLDTFDEVKIFSFELCDCEIEENGIFVRMLDLPSNCQGRVYGKHEFYLFEFNQDGSEGGDPSYKVVLFSAEKISTNLGNNYKNVGPILIYSGVEDTYTENPIGTEQSLYSLDCKYQLRPRSVADSIDFDWSRRFKTKTDQKFLKRNRGEALELVKAKNQQDSFDIVQGRAIAIDRVVVRIRNQVGGKRPISFDLDSLFGGNIVFQQVNPDSTIDMRRLFNSEEEGQEQ
ncbi:MAG: hypothetical protein AAGG75_05970 [Bacteroidota bacterium]